MQLLLQGVPLKMNAPKHHLFCDASNIGWGAHLKPEGLLFHGVWSADQSHLHINVLEMKAITFALHKAIRNSLMMVSTNKSTVVSYLKKQGGTHSPDLCVAVWNTLLWCQQNSIVLQVRHIPGRFNILADQLSRLTKPIQTEWTLKQSVVNRICQLTNFPNIDLFATRPNHRLLMYVSPISDDEALAIDALTMNWNGIHGYAFPPFHIIPNVLDKIRQFRCKIVLIAPFWPFRPWFPELLDLLVSLSIVLPITPNLLEQLNGKFLHQNPKTLALHAWELSNVQLERNFSKDVASFVLESRRVSTRRVYDAKWKVFCSWCKSRNFDPSSVTSSIVADFLLFLFRVKKLQISTIKGYNLKYPYSL